MWCRTRRAGNTRAGRARPRRGRGAMTGPRRGTSPGWTACCTESARRRPTPSACSASTATPRSSTPRAVIRGFCSGLPANLVRSASRSDPSEGEPAFSLANRGFRVAIVGHLKTKTPPLAVAPFDAKKAKEHQYAWAKHLGVDTEITNSIGMKLRLIPPGEFLMGSSPEQIARFEKIADEWARAGIRREGPQKKK